VEAGQIQARFRNQGSRPGDEVQRRQYDMGGTVSIGRLEPIVNIPRRDQGQAFGRYRRASDVAAQPLQFAPLVGLGGYIGVERKRDGGSCKGALGTC